MTDPPPKPVLLPKNDPLVAALAEWRRATCRAAGVSAYVVLPNATLLALAREKPSTLKDLLAVKGMGPARVEAYGLALLRLLRAGARRDSGSGKGRASRARGK